MLSNVFSPKPIIQKKIRKKKKGYVASSSIYLNTTSAFSYGKLIETAVFDKLSKYESMTFSDEQKREIDFIIKKNGMTHYLIPISSFLAAKDLIF
ncbi:MAG: hypothetical protein AB1391_03885 [Candidatus Micrarchaeota archaeon]